jgi:hypothetical protein
LREEPETLLRASSDRIQAGCKFPLLRMLRFNLLKRRTLAPTQARNSPQFREFEKTPRGVAGDKTILESTAGYREIGYSKTRVDVSRSRSTQVDATPRSGDLEGLREDTATLILLYA